MKFAEIIKNSGLKTEDFPKSSKIEIELYDGKERLSTEESVKYGSPLFEERPIILENFKAFIAGLEKEEIAKMNVKIDINSVVLFYKTGRAISFPRVLPLDPLDYAD